MLFGGVGREHPNDDVVTLCEGYVLVGEVVVGLGERRGDYVPGAATEHKTKEPREGKPGTEKPKDQSAASST